MLVAFVFTVGTAAGQTSNWKEMHKVKRKETIFGIARDNGITVEELMNANPDMKQPGYELKKGDYIFIPYPKDSAAASGGKARVEASPAGSVDDMRRRAIRVGVMLPLHNVNGDGRRMVEYYRGVQVEATLLPKVQVDMVVSKVPVRTVIETAKKVLYTGHIGDGKIFVYDVENVVKVRTSEEGYEALQDVE